MIRQTLAIANCRVSSDEQLLNNSLNRQREAVKAAAVRLDAVIPEDGWWSGSVSSKRGGNLKRKDIQAMLEYCKKHPAVKYLIVDEPDRFMRSVEEAMYLELEFKQLGVKVWYASDDDLNSDNMQAKLMKFMKYFVAEGSNEERQRKSIAGRTVAVREGRYPFAPKPGYMKGHLRGIPDVHPTRGPALQSVLIKIASHLITPSKALVELNASEFIDGHAPYKLDKFRDIVTDPFYAGILDVNKQVKVRNEYGLHQALITKEQHYALLEIMDGKKKTQGGPRKNGNPKYPGNNITICDSCLGERNGRFVGFDHSNGKKGGPIYEKYRCRACGMYLFREEMHEGIEKQFKNHPLTEEGRQDFLEALNIVWKQREGQAEQEARSIAQKIDSLRESVRKQAEAAIDPSNISIKEEILEAIEVKKQEVGRLEDELERLRTDADDDKEEFLRFALGFAEDMGARFLDPSLSQENRLRCKQVMFPAGFHVDKNKKVHTPEVSELVRLAHCANGNVVRVTGL